MRQKMLDGHPNHTELFDVKHDLGGMVDVEFMVQALVLGFANKYPELTKNKGNIALLKKQGNWGWCRLSLPIMWLMPTDNCGPSNTPCGWQDMTNHAPATQH